MKRKIILTAVLSAMLLAGCTKETELINGLQPTETALSEQTEATAAETDYILGGETETTVGETEATENAENFIARISWKAFDYGSLTSLITDTEHSYGYFFLKDNIFCAPYVDVYDNGATLFQRLRFYDIAENKLLTVIDIPEGWTINEVISETDGDDLCRYVIDNVTHDDNGSAINIDYAVMTVHNDLSYDISEGYTPRDRSVKCCGHNIAEWENDIVDADSGDVLAEGYDGTSEYDLYITWQYYFFPIDENRFVYRTAGYERLPGFGIYDFSEGRATDVPDSKDLIPLGVHGGKIYSVKTAWDGYGTELYVTDTETLETEFFMDSPVTAEMNDYVEYAMPESGNYIALKFQPEDRGASALLYGINPDTKELTATDIPDEFRDHRLERADGNRIMISNRSDKALIAEIDV